MSKTDDELRQAVQDEVAKMLHPALPSHERAEYVTNHVMKLIAADRSQLLETVLGEIGPDEYEKFEDGSFNVFAGERNMFRKDLSQRIRRLHCETKR